MIEKKRSVKIITGDILRVSCLFIGLFMIIATFFSVYYLFINKSTPPIFIKKVLEGTLSGEFHHTYWEKFQTNIVVAVEGVLFSTGIGLLFLWIADKMNKILHTKEPSQGKGDSQCLRK